VVYFGSPALFRRNLAGADVIITALDTKLDKPLLDCCPRLKLIGTRTTQLRYIDLSECARRGIQVINIKASSPVLRKTPSTAEETMALIFALTRKIPWAFDSIKAGKWMRLEYCGTELAGKTVGLVGFGRLGRMVARYCKAFSTAVIAYDPYVGADEMRRFGARKVSLDRLLRIADIVSLHTVYNDQTYRFFTAKHFQKMKKGSFFINTARGEITDEKALLGALRSRRIAGAAVDTLAGESPDGRHLKGNPLVQWAREHENLIIVPHIGGTTVEAIERTQSHIADLIIRAIRKNENRMR
jgi:D-3-phosphoglycerate dehydrogenase